MLQTDIGAYLEPAVGLDPTARAAGTFTGTGVDRLNTPSGQVYQYYSAVLAVNTGATTGAPTSFTVDAKLQDSADNSTFADFKPDGVNVASIPTITAASSVSRVNANLTTARRYLRASTTVAFVGGASPTVLVSALIILGGADRVATV